MNQSPFDWYEDCPGAVRTATETFAPDAGSATLTIRIAWSDLQAAVQYIVGYSEVLGDPTFGYTLSRKTPARHPRWQNMFATKILSVVGVGTEPAPTRKNTTPANGQDDGDGTFSRTYGNWNQALMTIQFELPTYPILSDSDLLAEAIALGAGNNPQNIEYLRYVTRNDEALVEIQNRPDTVWSYAAAQARSVSGQPQSAGNIGTILRTPKASLKWTWHDVHEDWLLLGKLMPTNSLSCVGTINLNPFPPLAFGDQNFPAGAGQPLVQCPSGTLLLQPVKRRPRVQMHPAVQNGELPAWFFPRTYDVDLEWIYFNPPTDDQTYVKTSTGQIILVRGHNLAPLPTPSAITDLGGGFTYYTIVKTPSGLSDSAIAALLTSPIPSDALLLYQYTPHEILFGPPQSMPPPIAG